MSSAGILRYVAPRMARYAFDDPMAMSSSGGSWKSLFYFLLAAAGVGFAGYVYLVPYSKMERAVGSNQSAIADERRAAEIAIAERDKLKADLARLQGRRRRQDGCGRQAQDDDRHAGAAAQAGAGGAGRDRRRRAGRAGRQLPRDEDDRRQRHRRLRRRDGGDQDPRGGDQEGKRQGSHPRAVVRRGAAQGAAQPVPHRR